MDGELLDGAVDGRGEDLLALAGSGFDELLLEDRGALVGVDLGVDARALELGDNAVAASARFFDGGAELGGLGLVEGELALEQTGDYAALPPAVIVDVDETMIDNSPFESRLILSGESFDPAAYSACGPTPMTRPISRRVSWAGSSMPGGRSPLSARPGGSRDPRNPAGVARPRSRSTGRPSSGRR